MIKAFIRGQLIDRQGNVIKPYPYQEAHSLVSNFIRDLSIQMSSVAGTLTSTAGTATSVSPSSGNLSCNAAANTTNAGIVIGSGTNPVTMADVVLQTQITTNVYHQVQNFFINSPSSSMMEFILSRSFLNNTGSILTINEVGLYSAPVSATYMFDRTLYTVVVPTNGAVTMTYKFSIAL